MGKGSRVVAVEQDLQPAGTEAPEPAPRSLRARSLRWMAWGLGIAIVACIAGYIRGGLGLYLFTLLPAGFFFCTVWAYGIQVGIRALLRKPEDLGSAPIVLGMAVFGTAALFGGLYAMPRIYAWHVESVQDSAVQAVDAHRKRTGRNPATADAPTGLPDEVSYYRSEGEDAYTLRIRDRFSSWGAWRFESSSRTWTYDYD